MAQCFGVKAPDEAAASLIDRILLGLGGAHIYLPKSSMREKQKKNFELVKKFNGTNLFEFAKEYEISPRHARRVIAKNAQLRP
ncbi:Mor transcription activator family protein [compost metagenome]